MLSVAFSVTNDVIMKALTLLKIIYVLSNFLDFIGDFTNRYFSLQVYFKGNLANSANKFNNMTS